MKKQVMLYGLSLGALIALLKAVEYRLVIKDHAMEAYGGVIAVLFTALGVWLALRLTKPGKEIVVVQKEAPARGNESFILNEAELAGLGISKREHEVLELMAGGLSNQEIADRLFISLNTVKTHSSKLFEKLDVSRRTQAVQKAKALGLIP